MSEAIISESDQSMEDAEGTPAESAFAPRAAQAPAGRFEKHEGFKSSFLEPVRDVLVYLPPGYDETEARRYPVLYLHDGQNLFDPATSYVRGQDWRFHQTAESLLAERAIEPLIIVGIYNAGVHRVDEYTPTRVRDSRVGGKAELYGRLLVEELKPFIDAHYRTRTDAESTGLGGSSLGGLVSLHLGCQYPHIFRKLALVSPSVWWDEKVIVRRVRALGAKLPLRIWLDVGTREGRQAMSGVLRLRDTLIAKGWQLGEDLCFFSAEGARHNEADWALRVEPILRFLFPANE